MLKKNRIISLILSVGMLLGMVFPFGVSAEGGLSDISTDHVYYSAITNLVAEGIINGFDDGTYKPEDPVTRAQFTKIICYATGVGDVTYSEGQRASFPDVDPNHWAIDNITTAKNSKIINGYDDGTFKPENQVLYEQAVKMVVCAIGYPEDRAEREGGYPSAFLNYARTNKILSKVDGVVGQPLTRGKVAQLIDNMRSANRVDPETGEDMGSLRDEETTSSSQEGRIVAVNKTILYDGLTGANKQLALELADGTIKNYWIDNINIENVYDYLGRSVVVYYNVADGAGIDDATKIVFAANKNKETTVNLDDVTGYSGTSLEYDDERGDEQTANVASGAKVVYNGAAYAGTFGDIMAEVFGSTGTVELVCSKGTDAADVVFVKKYITFIAGTANSSTHKVTVQNNATLSYIFDVSDRSQTITFIKDGKASSFTGISPGNIVSFARSENGKVTEVLISSKNIVGTIKETSNNKIMLDKSSDYYEYAASCSAPGVPTVGDYGTFYFDAFGKIARYILTTNKTLYYGYLSTLEEEGSLSEKTIQVVVYKPASVSATLKVENSIYTLADRVKIDGTSYEVSKKADVIKQVLQDAAANANINPVITDVNEPENALYAQPIRFSTSGTNVIDSIITNETTGSTSTSLNLAHHTTTDIDCYADGTRLGNFVVTSSTPIIIIPADRTGGTYKTSNNSCFEKDNGYYVQLANTTSSNSIGAIYFYGTADGTDVTIQTITKDNAPAIIKAKSSINDNGVTRTKLTLLCADGTEPVVMNNTTDYTYSVDFADLAVGDVVRYASDGTYFTDIRVVVKAADVLAGSVSEHITFDGTTSGEDDANAPLRTLVGLVRYVEGSTVIIAPSFAGVDGTLEENFTNSSAKVYVYDSSNTGEPVTEGTATDIIGYRNNQTDATKVLAYTSNGTLKMVIIFK